MKIEEWKKLEGFVELKITEPFDNKRVIIVRKDGIEYCIGSLELDLEEEEKSCDTCKHEDLKMSDNPCRICSPYYDKWEAKEEEIKICATCKHEYSKLIDKPCQYCADDYEKWEAKEK